MGDEPILYDIAGASRALGVSPAYLRELVREGKVPHRRLSDGPKARIRFTRGDLDRFTDSLIEAN